MYTPSLKLKKILKRRFLSVAGLAVAMLAASAVPSSAATVFFASGTFQNTATLSGTLTIDTVTGSIVASNLIVSAPTSFTFVNIVAQGDSPAPNFYSVTDRNAASTEDFDFGLPLHTLVGYSGGAICSAATATCTASNLFNLTTGTGGSVLASGSLSPTAPTPEPASGLLFGMAFVLLTASLRYGRYSRSR
jgi:hypothetical protein